jgi:hypothetical protein
MLHTRGNIVASADSGSLMALTLKAPAAPVTSSGLTLADIDRLRAKIEVYIDQLVAAERERMPGMPAVALRKLLMREQCLCAAARRLLEQQ